MTRIFTILTDKDLQETLKNEITFFSTATTFGVDNNILSVRVFLRRKMPSDNSFNDSIKSKGIKSMLYG